MTVIHRVDIPDSVTLHVESSGEGPAVLFGHSLLCDGRMFDDQVAALRERNRVVNIDMRGHGHSGVPMRDYTMAELGEDYVRVMDQLGIDRAVIVGLSMGAMAALHTARNHPRRVAGLVLMDTSHRPESALNRLEYLTMARIYRHLGANPLILSEVTRKLFGRTFRRHHRDVVASWRRRILRLDRRGVWHAVRCVANRPDATAMLARLEVPSLVVVGREDVATPVPIARDLAARLPRASLEILPRTGHLSTVEAPERTSGLIERFLESLDWRG